MNKVFIFLVIAFFSCQNTNKEMALIQAYLATDYQVYPTLTDTLHIQANQSNPTVDNFFNTHQSWAFITAWNPNSEPLAPTENIRRNQQLAKELIVKKLLYFSASGVPTSGDWPEEVSFLVLDISREKAIEMGKAYGQKAILWGKIGGTSELVFCSE